MIKQTLFISLGGAGGKLLNELININSSINGIFINSNINEMKKLNNFNLEHGNYLAINGNGSARNRLKTKEVLQKDKYKIMDFFSNIVENYNTYVIITSMDGGFGAGAFETVSKVIKSLGNKLGLETNINFVGVCPKLNSRRINLQNTIESYNDLIELIEQEIVQSYQFINNDKMIEEKSFNNEVMTSINNEYTIANEELDSNDSKLINNALGYKVILELREDLDLIESINNAINTNNFIMPKNVGYATHIGISIKEDCFNKEDILDKFNIQDFDKSDYNNENNLIILSGCESPTYIFEKYKEYYLKFEEHQSQYTPKIEFKNEHKTKPDIVNKPKTNLTKKDLRDLLDDIF